MKRIPDMTPFSIGRRAFSEQINTRRLLLLVGDVELGLDIRKVLARDGHVTLQNCYQPWTPSEDFPIELTVATIYQHYS